MIDIGFVVADDLILDGVARLEILEFDRRREDHTALGIEHGGVDDLRGGQLRFEFRDTALDEALLFLRCVVFGVFGQITLCAGLRDRGDHGRPLDRLEALQFIAQLLCATLCQRNGAHKRLNR